MSQLGGAGSMLPRENLNFKSSEMARNGSKTVLALVVRWGGGGGTVGLCGCHGCTAVHFVI